MRFASGRELVERRCVLRSGRKKDGHGNAVPLRGGKSCGGINRLVLGG